jgi:Spx/MgsR family transcriptional regulator
MTTELYGLERCGTCAKARGWLSARKIAYRFTDYREHPVAPATLRAWAQTLGWGKLVNRASATWRGLSDAQKAASSDAEWLALIAAFPALVKRPVLVRNGAVSVGFSVKAFAKAFRDPSACG